jgi:hypothetical protein
MGWSDVVGKVTKGKAKRSFFGEAGRPGVRPKAKFLGTMGSLTTPSRSSNARNEA